MPFLPFASARSLRRNLGSRAASLRESDRDRLLATLDPLPGPPRAKGSALPLAHRGLDLRGRPGPVTPLARCLHGRPQQLAGHSWITSNSRTLRRRTDPGNATDRQALVDAAHRFARDIPEVRSLSVGQALPQASPLVDSSFDVCLVVQFDDQAAMDRYAKHPVHQRAAEEAFPPLARKLLFYDFVVE